MDPACVKVLGSCTDVRVASCRFEHVACAVYARSGGEGIMDRLAVTDNDIAETDYGAIQIANGGEEPPAGNLYRVEVLRNSLYRIGMRPMRAAQGHALVVEFALLPEVAGNMLDRCWGAGLFIFGCKGSGARYERPLSRVLIHHNKVTDSLLSVNDYGGIESWQGGPAYIFDNVSGNPGGYWHWSHVMRGKTAEERNHTTARFGFAYYLDGAFKQYVFNNIAWGNSNDLTSPLCNACALQEVLGFLNAAFNNTFYKFGAGGRRHAAEAGRNAYLGNIWAAISDITFRHADVDSPQDASLARAGESPHATETQAYADNVFVGRARYFGAFDLAAVYSTLNEWREALATHEPLAAETGVEVDDNPLRDAEVHDFRLVPASAADGRGVRFFVPWGLYGVVGEWHFRRLPADPSRVLGEEWCMTDEFVDREMYRTVPRRDLKAVGVGAGDYVPGPLEDWTDGALRLNGHDQYCVMAHADMTADYPWLGGAYPGAKRRTLDMDTNDFLIEAVFQAEPGRAGGVIASKVAGAGYAVGLDAQGRVRMTLRTADGAECSRTSAAAVNDGAWHHVIAEVDRAAPKGVTLYVDGKRDDGEWAGAMPAAGVSLANGGDFLVGRGPNGDYLAGEMEFLRVSRGTLADAWTSIEELYDWEFDGPFLRDFAGREPVGRRDAGAIELVESP